MIEEQSAAMEWRERQVAAALKGLWTGVGMACPLCWKPVGDNPNRRENICLCGTAQTKDEAVLAHGLGEVRDAFRFATAASKVVVG